jgi:hypothetical protein
MPRKAANVPANEKEDARFIRVATSRVNSMLQSLKQLGTLGNPKMYKSTKEQRDQIQTALTGALTRCMESMNKGGEVTPEFKLK